MTTLLPLADPLFTTGLLVLPLILILGLLGRGGADAPETPEERLEGPEPCPEAGLLRIGFLGGQGAI